MSYSGNDGITSQFIEILKNPVLTAKKITESYKIEFILWLLSFSFFIPLFNFKKFFIVGLFFVFFALIERPYIFMKNFYYFMPIVPVIFIAFVDSIRVIEIKFKHSWLYINLILIAILIYSAYPYMKNFRIITDTSEYFDFHNYPDVKKVLNLVKKEQSVMTTTRFHYYTSNRKIVRNLHLYNIVEDVIILDFSERDWFLMAPSSNHKMLEIIFMKKISKLIEDEIFGIKFLEKDIVLLEKNYKNYEYEKNELFDKFDDRIKKNLVYEKKDNMINENILIPVYVPDNEPYLIYNNSIKKISGDIIISFYFNSKDRNIKDIYYSLEGSSDTGGYEIKTTYGQSIYILNEFIKFNDLELKNGMRKLEITVQCENDSLYKTSIPILFDLTPPDLKIENSNIFYEDSSPVEIKVELYDGKIKYLTSCMMKNENPFADKLFNKTNDMAYPVFLHYQLKSKGNLCIKKEKVMKIIASDIAGNITEILLNQ